MNLCQVRSKRVLRSPLSPAPSLLLFCGARPCALVACGELCRHDTRPINRGLDGWAPLTSCALTEGGCPPPSQHPCPPADWDGLAGCHLDAWHAHAPPLTHAP